MYKQTENREIKDIALLYCVLITDVINNLDYSDEECNYICLGYIEELKAYFMGL